MQIRTVLVHLCLHRQIGQIDRQVRKSLNNPQNWPRPICLAIFRARIGADRSALTEDRKTTSPNCPPFFGARLSPADLRRLPRTCAPDLAGAPQPGRLR